MAAIAHTVRDQIEAFKPCVGVMQALRNPGMRPRHFEKLIKQTGIQITLTPDLTFKSLLVLDVMKYEEIVKSVTDVAAKEYLIESTLLTMMAKWRTIKMDVFPYKNTGMREPSFFVYF